MNSLITIIAICLVETNLKNVTNLNDGGSPSYGICQIKERTARSMDFTTTRNNLKNIDFNLMVAKKYFESQFHRYKSDDKAISAYNAGHFSIRNSKYVRRVKRQRQRLIGLIPLIRQDPKSFFGLFGLQFSQKIQDQLQYAIGLNTGNKCESL